MGSGLFVVTFGKAGDEVFEDVAHVVCRHLLRRHVGLCGIEVRDHLIENAAFLHRRYLIFELHLLKDIAHVLRKAVQVVAEVGGDVLRVGKERLKSKLGSVVEIVTRRRLEKCLLHLKMLLRSIFLLHLGVCRQKAVVKTLHHRHRQNHKTIFMRLVKPRKRISHIPQDIGLLLNGLPRISFLVFHSHFTSSSSSPMISAEPSFISHIIPFIFMQLTTWRNTNLSSILRPCCQPTWMNTLPRHFRRGPASHEPFDFLP